MSLLTGLRVPSNVSVTDEEGANRIEKSFHYGIDLSGPQQLKIGH
jgi:hypothetical protein